MRKGEGRHAPLLLILLAMEFFFRCERETFAKEERKMKKKKRGEKAKEGERERGERKTDGDPSLVDDTTADDEGNPSPGEDTTANGPEPVTEPDTYAGTTTETEKAKERNKRPHRSAKPTTKADDYFYF